MPRSREIYPLNAPGMPPVGLDFVDEAHIRGDTIAQHSGSGKNKKLIVSPMLESLVRLALFGRGDLHINVTVKGTKKKQMPIIAGHLWDSNDDVPTMGPEPSDVMIIGKQLGDAELACSRCLVGPTGKLLYETLIKSDITSDDISAWYVTNVLKTGNPEGGDAWRQDWVKNFIHLLHQELRIVRPKYILCLGADAVKALLGKNMTLSKMDGQVVEYTYDVRRKPSDPEEQHTSLVMASVHPAAVLRSPEMAPKFELAIGRFVQLSKDVRWDQAETDIDHRLIYTEDELSALVDEILACGPNNIIALDCEWHGDHPQNEGSYLRTIQLSWAHKKAACIVLRHGGGEPAFKHYRRIEKDGKRLKSNKLTTDGAEGTVVRLLNKALRDNRPCGHFLNADLEWLVPFGVDLREQFAAPATWQECREKGGLDTALMAHALDETAEFNLTAQALRYTGAPRYDMPVIEWKTKYCKGNSIKASQLEGYGECPDEVLYPYALYDADVTRRIAMVHIKSLDSDQHGNNCWEAFWMSQRAALAVLEIKCTGIPIDNKRVDELTSLYMTARDELFEKIKKWANWPELNIASANHVRELLFGEAFNGKVSEDGTIRRLRPEDAKSLYAVPLLTTEKRPRKWSDLSEEEQKENTAGTGKQVLGMMYHAGAELEVVRNGKHVKENCQELIGWIRDYRYISQVLRSVLRPPMLDESLQLIVDDDDNWEYEAGLAGVACGDGRVRTTIYQTKETGRWSSARPPLQNLSKRREPDYRRILGDKYRYPLRSVLCSPPGYLLVEADYVGAELFGMAIMSGDETMIDHAQRNQLKENDPQFYDIHSNIAKLAFGYDCPATKAGLAGIGKSHMRIVAKAVVFGIAYGRQAKAIALAAKEEGVEVSQQDAQRIIDAVFDMYPGLLPFFEECRARAVAQIPGEMAPGWLCGPFGRFRRFRPTKDRQVKGEQERQAQNFPIQGMIADAVSLAVANLYDYRQNAYKSGWTVDDLDYKICLQVHDAIMCFVRYDHVPFFIETVLEETMIKGVPIYPCFLDGRPTGTGPYYLGTDTEVYDHWGVVPTPQELDDIGVHWKYAHWKEGSGVLNGSPVKGLVHNEAHPRKIWYDGRLQPLDAKK